MFDMLNEDLTTHEAFEPFLKQAVSKGGEVVAGSVLQIQAILNISIAKQDGHQQYDPERHTLKVTLTDGNSVIYALVADPIPRLTVSTAPGTKIKILHTITTHGHIILLSRNNVQVLGGNVPKLIEKWNFQRAMDIKKEWGAVGKIEGSDGPPLWQAFGHKSVPLDVAMLRKMKAMDIVNEKKEAEGDGSHTQFDQQRSEAITELMEKSVKQKWQKPTKHLIDKEVQEIIDEGFTFEEASNAMDKYKNQQKALRYLKASRGEYPPTRSTAPEDRKEKKRRGGKGDDEEEDYVPIPKEYQRPTSNISLFGFIAGSMNIDVSADSKDPVEKLEYESSQFRGGGRGGRGSGDRHFREGHRGLRRGRGDFGTPSERNLPSFNDSSSRSYNPGGEQIGRSNDDRSFTSGGGGRGHRGRGGGYGGGSNNFRGRGRASDDRSFARDGRSTGGLGSGSDNFRSYENSSSGGGYVRGGQRGRGGGGSIDYGDRNFSIYDNSPALPSPASNAQTTSYRAVGNNGLPTAGSDRVGRGRQSRGYY